MNIRVAIKRANQRSFLRITKIVRESYLKRKNSKNIEIKHSARWKKKETFTETNM
jgi:hypothetical protein